MPSQKMKSLARQWRIQKKSRGLSRVIAGLPQYRNVDKTFLETELFLTKEGNLQAHVVRQLAQTGGIKLIQQVISSKVDLNQTDQFGQNAAHLAARSGKGIALHELLRNKADVNFPNCQGKTTLHLAIEAGNSLMVKELILAKANVNARDNAGRSPLLLAILLDKKNRQCPMLYRRSVPDYLIDVNAFVGTSDRDGRNAFHYVVQIQDIGMLRRMCPATQTREEDKGVNAVSKSSTNAINHKKMTMESLSVTKQKTAPSGPAKSKLLLSNVHMALNAGDSRGVSPLALAAAKGYTEAVEILIESRADVNSKAHDGMQPLHWAIARCSVPVCMRLVRAKANLLHVTEASAQKLSPLGMAAHCRFTEMLEFLLKNARVPFIFGQSRDISGVDAADVPIIMQCAPPLVSHKYQKALVTHVNEKAKRRRTRIIAATQQPKIFNGSGLVKVMKGTSYEDQRDRMAKQRQRARTVRAEKLLQTANTNAYQSASIRAFTENALDNEDSMTVTDSEGNDEDGNRFTIFKAAPMPNFQAMHQTQEDTLAQFIEERRHHISSDQSPVMLDPQSEHAKHIETINQNYRFRLLGTLDLDTARFYRSEFERRDNLDSVSIGENEETDEETR